MLGNNNTVEKKYTNVKLVAVAWPIESKSDAPKFHVLDENFNLTDTTYTSIKWKLTWIKSTFTPKKWKMWDIYGFKAFIEDWDEVVVIESTITNASKDLLNALINSKDKVIHISLYVNKNWYPTSSVKDEAWAFIPWVMDFKSITPQWLTDAINNTFVKKEESSEIDISEIPF